MTGVLIREKAVRKMETPRENNATIEADVRRMQLRAKELQRSLATSREGARGGKGSGRGRGLGGRGELSFIRICVGSGTSLMVRWLRLCIPNAGAQVLSLVRELGPTCRN